MGVLALAVSATVFARTDYNLQIRYDFAVDPGWGSPIEYIIARAQGGSVDDTYGWGSRTHYFSGSPASTGFDTSWWQDELSQPTYHSSILLGVVKDLPNDAPGQKHLVIFMNSAAAANIGNIAYGTVFAGIPTLPTEEQLIAAIEDQSVEANAKLVDDFMVDYASRARAGVGGTEASLWFTDSFSIVAFSDAKVLGSGTVEETLEVVPEPASLAALGFGLVAFARRRRSV